jgi:tetratricopeptide (TPR) repeat protein
LIIAEEIGKLTDAGVALSHLGNVYYSLGNYATAIDYHQQSLAIVREIGDRQIEGML